MAQRAAADDGGRDEAYVKLFGQREVDWQNRGHFFGIAAQVMRRIFMTCTMLASRPIVWSELVPLGAREGSVENL